MLPDITLRVSIKHRLFDGALFFLMFHVKHYIAFLINEPTRRKY